jgi:predicted signal transduction protein with EAL and GGDEF domain
VRSIVVMGEALGLDVVAEGVERADQRRHLVEHAGATTGQGFLYQRPMALPEMVRFLSMQPSVIRTPPHPVDVGQSRLAADHSTTEPMAAGPQTTAAVGSR